MSACEPVSKVAVGGEGALELAVEELMDASRASAMRALRLLKCRNSHRRLTPAASAMSSIERQSPLGQQGAYRAERTVAGQRLRVVEELVDVHARILALDSAACGSIGCRPDTH